MIRNAAAALALPFRAAPVVAAVTLALTVLAGAAPVAKMTDLSGECIGTEAPKTLVDCPGGPKLEIKQKRAAAFKSAPPPRDVKKRQDESKPVNPDELKKYAERDTRKTRLQARALALLIAENQGLERLYRATKKILRIVRS